MNFPDYYEILGLPRFYPTQEEIRDAFLNKVVELNASGEVDPEARQLLDSAYLTLSDAKKKREYDEVLDRYVEVELYSARVITSYNYTDDGVWKSSWAVNSESNKIYHLLSEKVGTLNQILYRYPFIGEIKLEPNELFEISMLIFYHLFGMFSMGKYSPEEQQQIVEDGILLLTLFAASDDQERKNQQIVGEFFNLADELSRAAAANTRYKQETLFHALNDVYIFQVFNWKNLLHKTQAPDFQEAFSFMENELINFWKNLCEQMMV